MSWLSSRALLAARLESELQLSEKSMKAHYAAIAAMLVGIGFSTVAIESLHAQAKPPVYFCHFAG